MKKSSILDLFPKKRIELPDEYRAIYDMHYLTNRNGEYATTSLSQKLESWMHRQVAKDIRTGSQHTATLEIGAGTLNQLAYEQGHTYYDIVEPFSLLFEHSPLLTRVRTIYKDISEITDATYDRITCVATFEHIMDLPFVVAAGVQLLSETGHMRVAIPNEGTFMWWLGTQITGYEFKKKYGLEYQTLMKYEHVNTADDIEAVLSYFFENVECAVLGISKRFAFYRFYDCSGPNLERAQEYIRSKAL